MKNSACFVQVIIKEIKWSFHVCVKQRARLPLWSCSAVDSVCSRRTHSHGACGSVAVEAAPTQTRTLSRPERASRWRPGQDFINQRNNNKTEKMAPFRPRPDPVKIPQSPNRDLAEVFCRPGAICSSATRACFGCSAGKQQVPTRLAKVSLALRILVCDGADLWLQVSPPPGLTGTTHLNGGRARLQSQCCNLFICAAQPPSAGELISAGTLANAVA